MATGESDTRCAVSAPLQLVFRKVDPMRRQEKVKTVSDTHRCSSSSERWNPGGGKKK